MAEKTTAFTGPVVVGLNDKKGEIRLTDGKNPNEAKYLSIAAPDTLTSNATLTFPNSVGTNGQFLKTDGNGDLTWSTPDTGGIAAVVDDTAPELGGDLASNGHDINFADNDKAKFGNSGDLEIFHDGTNSLIKDVGTGQLKISGFDAVKITNGDDTIPSAQFISSGEAQLYYAGSQKLAANTDGITVTGKVVSDGLEVDGDIKLDGNYPDGGNNVVLGADAGVALTGASASNTLIGSRAGTSITSGLNNVAIGRNALDANITSSGNVAVGNSAGGNSTGEDNTFLGGGAGSAFTTGSNVTIIGNNAEASSSTVSNEVTIGDANVTSLRIPGLQSGASTNDVLTFDGSKIVLATAAGPDPVTSSLDIGSTKTISLRADYGGGSGTGNLVMGKNSFATSPTGAQNTIIGSTSGQNIGSGSRSTVIGAGSGNGSGSANTIVGAEALYNNVYGDNTVVGTQAGGSGFLVQTTTLVGYQSGQNLDTSDNNTFVGYHSGRDVTTGKKNTRIGSGTGGLTTNQNCTVLGYNATASSTSVTNEITLGDSSIGTLRCNATSISSLSDARDKKDVEDANIGLDFINDLRPVKFVWDTRDGAKKDIKEVGFIAQDLDAVQQKHGVEDSLRLVLKTNPDKLEAAPGKLIPILVQAIKDLKKEIDELKKA